MTIIKRKDCRYGYAGDNHLADDLYRIVVASNRRIAVDRNCASPQNSEYCTKRTGRYAQRPSR